MPRRKPIVTWKEHANSKEEDQVIIEWQGQKIIVPARLFTDMTDAGVHLLTEHHHGAFVQPEDITIKMKAGKGESDGLIIASIAAHGQNVIDIWCDKVTRWGGEGYCFYVGDHNIGMICTPNEVEVDDSLSKRTLGAKGEKA
jgi:hypothetical protein